MIRLVVNADDLGLSPAIDEGIFEAARSGIVTSASLLVVGTSFESALAGLLRTPLGIGIHLAAVGGFYPVLPPGALPGLCEKGRLPRSWKDLVGKLVRTPSIVREILSEFDAQLAKARDAGVVIDHVDAHQHLHLWPRIFSGVVDLCRRYAIKGIRLPDEPPCFSAFRSPVRTAARGLLAALAAAARFRLNGLGAPCFHGLYGTPTLVETLHRIPEGDHEICCHPGLHVRGVPEDPDWVHGWDAERVALCAPEAREMIERRGIQLCRYSEIYPPHNMSFPHGFSGNPGF